MKMNLKTMIIAMTAILVMMLTAAPVSASEGYVDDLKVTKNSKAVKTVTTRTGSSTSVGFSYTGYSEKTPTWKTSNTKIATVKKNSNGTAKVVGKKAGTVKLTAELEGEKVTCTVKVKSSWVGTKDCYTELNKYRKAAGKKALKQDKQLVKVAKIRAEEMAKSGKFSHTRPNGKSGLTLIKGNIYKGENIAMGQRTGKQVSTAWYNSKGHKKNMLKKQYKKVGIAGYEHNGVIYWAQVFSS